jgi:hypothetical protein
MNGYTRAREEQAFNSVVNMIDWRAVAETIDMSNIACPQVIDDKLMKNAAAVGSPFLNVPAARAALVNEVELTVKAAKAVMVTCQKSEMQEGAFERMRDASQALLGCLTMASNSPDKSIIRCLREYREAIAGVSECCQKGSSRSIPAQVRWFRRWMAYMNWNVVVAGILVWMYNHIWETPETAAQQVTMYVWLYRLAERWLGAEPARLVVSIISLGTRQASSERRGPIIQEAVGAITARQMHLRVLAHYNNLVAWTLIATISRGLRVCGPILTNLMRAWRFAMTKLSIVDGAWLTVSMAIVFYSGGGTFMGFSARVVQWFIAEFIWKIVAFMPRTLLNQVVYLLSRNRDLGVDLQRVLAQVDGSTRSVNSNSSVYYNAVNNNRNAVTSNNRSNLFDPTKPCGRGGYLKGDLVTMATGCGIPLKKKNGKNKTREELYANLTNLYYQTHTPAAR